MAIFRPKEAPIKGHAVLKQNISAKGALLTFFILLSSYVFILSCRMLVLGECCVLFCFDSYVYPLDPLVGTIDAMVLTIILLYSYGFRKGRIFHLCSREGRQPAKLRKECQMLLLHVESAFFMLARSYLHNISSSRLKYLDDRQLERRVEAVPKWARSASYLLAPDFCSSERHS